MEREAWGVEVTSPCHRLASWGYEIHVLPPTPAMSEPLRLHETDTGTPTAYSFWAPFPSEARVMDPRRQGRPTFPEHCLRASTSSRFFAYTSPTRTLVVGIINPIMQRRKWRTGDSVNQISDLCWGDLAPETGQSWGDLAPETRWDSFQNQYCGSVWVGFKWRKSHVSKAHLPCVAKEDISWENWRHSDASSLLTCTNSGIRVKPNSTNNFLRHRLAVSGSVLLGVEHKSNTMLAGWARVLEWLSCPAWPVCKCQVNTEFKCNLTIVQGLFALDIIVSRKGEGAGGGKMYVTSEGKSWMLWALPGPAGMSQRPTSNK